MLTKWIHCLNWRSFRIPRVFPHLGKMPLRFTRPFCLPFSTPPNELLVLNADTIGPKVIERARERCATKEGDSHHVHLRVTVSFSLGEGANPRDGVPFHPSAASKSHDDSPISTGIAGSFRSEPKNMDLFPILLAMFCELESARKVLLWEVNCVTKLYVQFGGEWRGARSFVE